jgi:hypothetical protein
LPEARCCSAVACREAAAALRGRTDGAGAVCVPAAPPPGCGTAVAGRAAGSGAAPDAGLVCGPLAQPATSSKANTGPTVSLQVVLTNPSPFHPASACPANSLP